MPMQGGPAVRSFTALETFMRKGVTDGKGYFAVRLGFECVASKRLKVA